MDRSSALSITFIIYIIFFICLYFYLNISLFSTLVICGTLSLILLFSFYSPFKIVFEVVDFSLITYILYIILTLILIFIYVAVKAFKDTQEYHNKIF